MTEKTKKSLYEIILEKGGDAFKGINERLSRKRDIRAFESAYDNALEKKEKAQQDKIKLFEKIGDYSTNMEKILKLSTEERQAEITIEILRKEYKEIFGEEMKTEE